MLRTILVSVLAAALLSACAQADTTPPPNLGEFERIEAGFASITSQELNQAISYLASPELEGRRSGTEGNARAGEFIAKEFFETGVRTLGSDYFQNFSFTNVERPDIPIATLETWRERGWKINFFGRNVIGILEGTDKKDEYVFLTAHYDHLGIQGNTTYPGADDNASGTAAVLEIAGAFGTLLEQGIRPQRSIVFALFDAEEWGLWGSEYFVEHSPVPLENIVAVINFDMVGRNKTGNVDVIGSAEIDDFATRNPGLSDALGRANAVLGFNLNLPTKEGRREQIFFRSDHASFFFARDESNRIPVLFLTSGLHDDYHKPSDTRDKINSKKARDITRLAFLAAWYIADHNNIPVFYDK